MGVTLSGFPRPIATAIVPGGAAGNHKVVGDLRAGDSLISVRHVSADLVTNADLTAQFTIPAASNATINNAAGTDTTGNFLIVTWAKAE